MKSEPKIAETLRKYLAAVGRRHNAVRLTAKQIKDLTDAGLLHPHLDGVLRFEGQAISHHEAEDLT